MRGEHAACVDRVRSAVHHFLMRASRTYWASQLFGWGFYALSNILGAIAILRSPVASAVRDLGLLSALGVLATHALRGFVTRRKWSEMRIATLLLRMTAAAVALGIVMGAISLIFPTTWLQDSDFRGTRGGGALTFGIQCVNWTFLILVWQCLYFSTLTFRARQSALLRQSELARALQFAELRALKSQINPHFLFNALNTVRSLIADDPKRAQEAVTRLAGTLRSALGTSHSECVTLEKEMATVDDYLMLESLRFEDRLKVERHIAPETLAWSVPVMLVQTLVENAIKHGVAARPGPGVVEILAALEAGRLAIEVRNPRAEVTQPARTTGVGLQNARERLRLMFGVDAALNLDLSHPDVAVARVTLPGSLARE
jgi:anti-sigma regulatory factor (Ser/Thr protein kinase)